MRWDSSRLIEPVLPWEIQSRWKHHIKESSIASHDFFIKLPTAMSSLREALGMDKSELLIVAGKSLFGHSGTITHAVAHQAPVMYRRRDMIGARPSSSVLLNHVKLP